MGAVVVILVLVMGLIGWRVGVYKGRPVLGAVLGLILGIIGLIILAFVPRTYDAQVSAAARQQAVAAAARDRGTPR